MLSVKFYTNIFGFRHITVGYVIYKGYAGSRKRVGSFMHGRKDNWKKLRYLSLGPEIISRICLRP
jgi:hypothetical protein